MHSHDLDDDRTTAGAPRRRIHSTTILGVRHNGRAAMGGDGQVTFGDMILKHNARKVRRLYKDTVLAGFAGAAADAFTLFDKFEAALEATHGNLSRAAVALARAWRNDRMLRRLEAQLAVMDVNGALILSGTGDLVEVDDGVIAIGSGAPYALGAARALTRHSEMPPADIVRASLGLAGEMCLYTNTNIMVEEVGS